LKWDTYGFVIASRNRVKVIKCLFKHPKTPKQISTQTGTAMAHVSRILAELTRESITLCINPNRVKGRVYQLTELGETIAKLLESNSAEEEHSS